MTNEEIQSLKVGDVIFNPLLNEWIDVLAIVKEYKFWGKRTGAKLLWREGYMHRHGPITLPFEVNFFKNGVIITSEKQLLALQLKYSSK